MLLFLVMGPGLVQIWVGSSTMSKTGSGSDFKSLSGSVCWSGLSLLTDSVGFSVFLQITVHALMNIPLFVGLFLQCFDLFLQFLACFFIFLLQVRIF